MSRSLTIVEGLKKIQFGGHLLPRDSIHVSVLGADEKECGKLKQSAPELTCLYSPVFDFLSSHGYATLHIHFIGPAIPHHEYGSSSSFSFTTLEGLAVNVTTSRLCYHELTSKTSIPDIILLFNSGIWGYDSWIPSLKAIHSDSLKKQCFCLVTSYTLEESEDDYDKIEEVLGGGSIHDGSLCAVKWIWNCEINPHRSTELLPEVSKAMGREYYEQYAWSCFWLDTTIQTISYTEP